MKPVSLFAFDDEVARCKIWRIWFISSRLRDYIDKQVPCSRLRDLGKSTCDRLWDFFCFFARGEAHSGDCTRRRRGKPAYVRSSQRGLRARCIYDQLRRRGGLSRRNTRVRIRSRDSVYILLKCTLQDRSDDRHVLCVEIDKPGARIVVIDRVVGKKVEKISIGVRRMEIQPLKAVRCVFWPKTVAKVARRRERMIEYRWG